MAHHKRINGVMHHHDGVYEEGGKAGRRQQHQKNRQRSLRTVEELHPLTKKTLASPLTRLTRKPPYHRDSRVKMQLARGRQ